VALDPFTGAIAQDCLRSSGNREEHILIALVRAVFRRESRLRFGDKIVEGVAPTSTTESPGRPLPWTCKSLRL
jgi:hypothetical protein